MYTYMYTYYVYYKRALPLKGVAKILARRKAPQSRSVRQPQQKPSTINVYIYNTYLYNKRIHKGVSGGHTFIAAVNVYIYRAANIYINGGGKERGGGIEHTIYT